MKIEDLTIEEAKIKIDQANLLNKQIEIKKSELQQKMNRQKDEKVEIKSRKSTKLKNIQKEINKQGTQSGKEYKRKEKKRESDSFDKRIKLKEEEIKKTRNEIDKLKKNKANNVQIKELLNQHVKQLKK